MPIRLLVAGDPGQYTGGYLYDARIAQGLASAGRAMEVVGLDGRFPVVDAVATRALASALEGCPDGCLVVIDGLVLAASPEVLAPHAARLRLIALIHHPVADEAGLEAALRAHLFDTERRALRLVAHVVATSPFTARHLVADYGVDAAALTVIVPGVDRPIGKAAVARPRTAGAPCLLCVASLIPRKGHTVLVEALARLMDLDWRCVCVGDTRRDPACTEAVRAAIHRAGLEGRVRLAGSRSPEDLVADYRSAWLFVLPSYYEGYGMVVAEALSYGLPVVATTGGALAETLPPGAGLGVPPGDSRALAAALRRLLADAALHASLCTAARKAAETLPGWDVAGLRFAGVLDRVESWGGP